MRDCDGCRVCCYVGEVAALDKPHHTPCPKECSGGCSIFGSPERPLVCEAFQCAWSRGLVDERYRPDKCGIMLSVNRTPNGIVGFAIEVEPDSHRNGAVAELAEFTGLPIVICKHGGDDIGDWVAIRDNLADKMLKGAFVDRLSPDVSMYELVRADG